MLFFLSHPPVSSSNLARLHILACCPSPNHGLHHDAQAGQPVYVEPRVPSSPPPPQADPSAAPSKPIKKLPPSIQVAPDTTVEDVKKQVAKAIGLGDHNRIGLFDPSTKKTIKDRKAPIAHLDTIVAAGEVLVKDLGKSGLNLYTFCHPHLTLLCLQAPKSRGSPSSS